MKYIVKYLFIICAATIFFLQPGGFSVYAEESSLNLRILTIPIVNETDNEQLDPLCSFIDDQIDMTLNILGNYDLYHMDKVLKYNPLDERIQQFVKTNSIDKVIYGSLKPSDNKTLFDLKVFDITEKEVSISETESITSVFDIFDVMDEKVTSMLESLTGIHIGYGGLFLTNTGETGTFHIELNGITLGETENVFDHLLNGNYKLDIIQNRFNKKVVIYSKPIRIEENKNLKLNFSIPYLTDSEKTNINNLLSAFEKRKQGSIEITEAQDSAKSLINMFEDISFCPNLKSYKKDIEKTIFQWKLFEEQLDLIKGYEKGTAPSIEITDTLSTSNSKKNTSYDMAVFLTRAMAFDYFKNKQIEQGIETYLGTENYFSNISNNFREVFLDEYNFFTDINTEFSFARKNRPGIFWPWTSIVSGLVLGGLSTWMFIDTPPSELEPLKWSGTAASPILVGLGTWGLISNSRYGKSEFESRLNFLLKDYRPLRDELFKLQTPEKKVNFVNNKIKGFVLNNSYGNLPVLEKEVEETEVTVKKSTKAVEYDPFMWSISVGGGSYLTTGFLWRPWRWLGIQTGVAGTFGSDEFTADEYFILTIPLEFDFFILQKKLFNLYTGITADTVKYLNYLQEPITDLDTGITSNVDTVDYIKTLGISLGVSIPTEKFKINFNNYFYFTGENIVYSPAVGILF